MLRRLVIAVVCSFAFTSLTVAARAELVPGWYATGCKKLAPAKTRAAAAKQCKRPGDVVHLTATTPSFWVASFTQGKTRRGAIAACRAAARKSTSRAVSEDELQYCDRDVSAAYGPFKRTKSRGGYDDPDAFPYLTDTIGWVDAHGEAPCFVTGTRVATPDGERPIESLDVGARVWSWSPEERAFVIAQVTAKKERVAASVLDVTLADGRTLHVTANHPLWSPSLAAWVLAGALAIGDSLAVRESDGLVATAVTAINGSAVAGPITVWDLTVVPTHSYFAAGIWAHNY